MVEDRGKTGNGQFERCSVLLVEDDIGLAHTLERVLRAANFVVSTATNGAQAVKEIASRPFDVIVTDINLPEMSGIDLLRTTREHDLDVPVILMTANPTFDSAVEAVTLGALQYFTKPVPNSVLVKAVERAYLLHRLARIKRDALRLVGERAVEAGDRAGLQGGLDRALERMWMAFQPIVNVTQDGIFGYEALMRSPESSLPHPGAILDAAERLERLAELGQRVRALSAEAFVVAPPGALLFVNLHPSDLLDPDLYSVDAPLTKMAERVVLEITERAALDRVGDVPACVARLRALGFRVAIDDLGAGYAGLSSFVELSPDFVKLDISLVRDVHKSPIRRQLVGALTSVSKELGIHVLAEGIEHPEERDAVIALGCELLQGYFFAKPGRPFPPLVGAIRPA